MIGLSTYAYFWRMHERSGAPMSLADVLRDTAEQRVHLFQICDHAPLADYDDAALADLRALAGSLGIRLQVGTRGTAPDTLRTYLRLARALGADLVRSMWTAGDDRPDRAETEQRLRAVLPEYRAAGVRLSLETYEQVSSTELVAVVEAIDDPLLGICLDPANCVANLELPLDVTDRCARHVSNWHVKDFAFGRKDGWVGFSLVGTALGEGRLDYAGMRDRLRPHERGIDQVVEFWLPWQGDATTTERMEADWTASTLTELRKHNDD